jgi:3-deoxy-D-manno-octulosonic acid (KDO) 8-phosphate synthase
METHEDPSQALSDGPNAYRLDRMKTFLTHLKKIHALAQERR